MEVMVYISWIQLYKELNYLSYLETVYTMYIHMYSSPYADHIIIHSTHSWQPTNEKLLRPYMAIYSGLIGYVPYRHDV